MNRIQSQLNEIDMIGKLADLKEEHYLNTLIMSAVVELLIEKKGLLTSQEISQRAKEIDQRSFSDLGDPMQ